MPRFRNSAGSCATVGFLLAAAADPARGEGYVAGYIGGAQTRAATVVVEQSNPTVRLSFEKLPFEGRSFQSPIYYGYRAGYYFTRHFGSKLSSST
jgi:hypothetical protein